MKWFQHDTNASTDAKIRKLLLRHGTDGYAVYFHCIELIAGAINDKNITFELEHDAEIIADNLKIKGDSDFSAIDKVNNIMKTIISLGLFESSNNKIVCMKLAERMDNVFSRNPEIKKIKQSSKSTTTQLVRSNNVAEEKRREDNKIDKYINYWNTKPSLPKTKLNSLNLTHDISISILNHLKDYTHEEITQAVDNYDILMSKEKAFPIYTTVKGFLKSGVEKYYNDSKPFERCKVKKPNQQSSLADQAEQTANKVNEFMKGE